MAVSRQSLSEDFANRYNHTWSVLLLLSLAAITWLLPFSLVVSQFTIQSPEPPRYKATCWTPKQFTLAQVIYSNKFCAGLLNTAIRQENPGVVGVYVTDMYDGSYYWDGQRRLYRPEATKKGQAEREEIREDTYFFVGTTVSLALFLFAVCLKLPHVWWRLMSSCGSINVDQTLDTAGRISTLDTDSYRQLISDLCWAAAKAAKSSRGVALSYLSSKLLLCVVTVVELLTLGSLMLPRLMQLKDSNHNSPNSSHYENDLLLICDIPIRQLQNVAKYSLQCLYSFNAETQMTSDLDSMTDVLLGYQALLTAVLAYLVILLVVNVLSVITWTSRLVAGTCRNPLTRGASSSSLSLDLFFLLLMSEENSSPLVTQSMARVLMTGSSPKDTDLDAL